MEWDYLPPVGPRPAKGFVGLKNAGATCYMNSVLQQLYMVESIRVGILASEGAAVDLNEDFSGEERMEGEVSITIPVQQCMLRVLKTFVLTSEVLCLMKESSFSIPQYRPGLPSYKTSHRLNPKFPFKTMYFLGVRGVPASSCILYRCTTSGRMDLWSIYVLYIHTCVQYKYISIQFTVFTQI